MANLVRNYQRFDKNLQRDDKKGHLDKWPLKQTWQIGQQFI